MSSKRQRLTLEMTAGSQAAQPAVCYLPSIEQPGVAENKSTRASADDMQSPINRLKCKVLTKQRGTSSVQLVHASLGETEFIGRSDGPENNGTQSCCYVLGVYQPMDKKLQLVKVAGDQLFRLDARLPGLIYAPTGAGEDEDGDERERRREAARKLVDEFGSTRRRRKMTAREAGLVVADRISGGNALKEMLSGLAARGQEGGLTTEETNRRAFAQRTIPPHDPKAITAADAYPLELLLSRSAAAGKQPDEDDDEESLVTELNVVQIYKLLEDNEELKKCKEKGWVHPYVIGRLEKLRPLKLSNTLQSQARAKELAGQLALLAALLKLFFRRAIPCGSDGLLGVAREFHLRENLMEFLLERFFVRTEDPLRGIRYERPDPQQQLLLSYILAVAMVIEDGLMEKELFESLREALKMEAHKVAAAMHQLGCLTRSAKLMIDEDSGHSVPSYNVTLLRFKGFNTKRLEECFPAIKTMKAKNR